MKNTSTIYLSAGKIARLIGVSRGTVLRWIHDGRMKAHRLPGGQFRVSLKDLREFCVRHDLPVPELSDKSIFPYLPEHLRCDRCIFDDPPGSFGEMCPHCEVFEKKAAELYTLLERYEFPAAAVRAEAVLAANSKWERLFPGFGPGTPLDMLAERGNHDLSWADTSPSMAKLAAAPTLKAVGFKELKLFPCGLGGIRCTLAVPFPAEQTE